MIDLTGIPVVCIEPDLAGYTVCSFTVGNIQDTTGGISKNSDGIKVQENFLYFLVISESFRYLSSEFLLDKLFVRLFKGSVSRDFLP